MTKFGWGFVVILCVKTQNLLSIAVYVGRIRSQEATTFQLMDRCQNAQLFLPFGCFYPGSLSLESLISWWWECSKFSFVLSLKSTKLGCSWMTLLILDAVAVLISFELFFHPAGSSFILCLKLHRRWLRFSGAILNTLFTASLLFWLMYSNSDFAPVSLCGSLRY